ncbi:GDSL-type esterase/lipase family protein [Dactylosporangium sp. NPDC049525]|uniref:GDSL-type esterase/lipase family protein n=1 Tax=Dactylosporangium sp. NPDC049525 TaxID=3154730 RepID=UPI00341A91AE
MSRKTRSTLRYLAAAVTTACLLLGTNISNELAHAATPACSPYAFSNVGLSGGIALNTCSRIVQLTSPGSSVSDDEPSLAPNGQNVAFRRFTNNVSEIFTVSTSGGTPFQVTHLGTENTEQPSWSPDSTQILFNGIASPADLHKTIYKVMADGSGLTVIGEGEHPVWCHNGRMAFAYQPELSPTREIHVVNSDGGNELVLTNGAGDSDPAWSPDCRYIFFDRWAPATGSAQIFTVPVTGGQPTQLTVNATGLDLNPSISNNWTMAFVHTPDGANPQIYLQWLGSASAVAQPATSQDDFWPSFSPGDGSVSAPVGFPIAVGDTQLEAFGGGDSYGSGEGAGGYTPDTNIKTNRCHRSPSSYQQIVADRLGYKLRFHACSGAVINDFYAPWIKNHSGAPNDGEIGQLDWLNSKIKLAMISVSGNDAHFPDVIQGCYLRDQSIFPTCESLYGSRVKRWISQIEQSGELVALYRNIKARVAPGAKILINEYPRFFRLNPTSACNAGGMVFRASDQRWINDSILRLDEIIASAAHKAGVTPVGTYDAFDGHELCSRQPWMNGLILDVNKSYRQQSFHPNALGYFAEAKLNLRKLGIK